MDKKEVDSLIEWWIRGRIEKQGWDIQEDFCDPLMEAFGDDVNEILDYLDNMPVEDLSEIEGVFEDIYGKFMTDEVWDALKRLRKKFDNR